jgi:hypothetical protein
VKVFPFIQCKNSDENCSWSPPFTPGKSSFSLEPSAEDYAITFEKRLDLGDEKSASLGAAKLRLGQHRELGTDDRLSGFLYVAGCRSGAARMRHCDCCNGARDQNPKENGCPLALNHCFNTGSAPSGKQLDIHRTRVLTYSHRHL